MNIVHKILLKKNYLYNDKSNIYILKFKIIKLLKLIYP